MEGADTSWLVRVKFWLIIVPFLPSTLCSISILLYFYRRRHHLSPHHHLILVLIVVSLCQVLTDMPFALIYYHYGEVLPASGAFCLWWNWWDYSLSSLLLFIMAWGSIDRHLLVFHNALVATRRRRVVFHIFPMLMCCAYPVVFYSAVILMNSCENDWDFTTLFCLQPCYLSVQEILGAFDFVGNISFPILLIILANISLIVRVWRRKRSRRGASRHQRKLTIQLLTIATLYVVFWFPMTLNGLIYTFTKSEQLGELQGDYLIYLPYMVPLALPFISLPFLPDFRQVVFKIPANNIAPTVMAIPRSLPTRLQR